MKRQTKSSSPSPLTSCGGPQKAKLASFPVRPNLRDAVSNWVPALKLGVERMATGVRPLLPGLMAFGNPPGLMSIATAKVVTTNSKAPISQPELCGRVTPRWSLASVVPQPFTPAGIASMAGLPGRRAIVCVGPPLFFTPVGSSSGSVLESE